jgi:hypothetical protein
VIDLLIVFAFVVYAIGSGLRARRQASQNLQEYFVAGKTIPGWKAGLSMAATQFAADTPLLVTGLVATAGIFALWRLWVYALAFPPDGLRVRGRLAARRPDRAHRGDLRAGGGWLDALLWPRDGAGPASAVSHDHRPAVVLPDELGTAPAISPSARWLVAPTAARFAGVLFAWVQIFVRSLFWLAVAVSLLVLYPFLPEELCGEAFARPADRAGGRHRAGTGGRIAPAPSIAAANLLHGTPL